MRIRSIKPEFWSSDDIAELEWDDRLLFIGLWSYVADSGVGRDNPKLITADLFPLEDDPIETLATVSRGLARLSEAGLITRYEVKGKRYLHINEWTAHQRIDKPTRSPFPPPTCEDAVIVEPSRPARESSRYGARDLGNEGARERGSKGSSSDKSDQTDYLARFDEFWDAYDNKLGRKKCEPAFAEAIKAGNDPALLISAAGYYVAWCQRNQVFQKNPLTWLNGEHWRDELPERPTRPTTNDNVKDHFALARRLAEQEQGATIREIGPRR